MKGRRMITPGLKSGYVYVRGNISMSLLSVKREKILKGFTNVVEGRLIHNKNPTPDGGIQAVILTHGG